MDNNQTNAPKRDVKEPLVILAGVLVLALGVVYYVYNKRSENVASVQPVAQPATVQDISPKEAPKLSIVATPVPDADEATFQAPKFDLVRVDAQGSAVVAGQGEPGSQIDVLIDGEKISQATVGADGAFVALFDMPQGDKAVELTLNGASADGADNSVSKQAFLVMPNAGEQIAPPKIVALSEQGADVIQGANIDTPRADAQHVADLAAVEPAQEPVPITEMVSEPVLDTEPAPIVLDSVIEPKVLSSAAPAAPTAPAQLSLETITYSDTGDVVFAGRGGADSAVRVYVDNKPIQTGLVDGGEWRLTLPNVDEGIYTVRVDALDDQGQVTARVESPFKRETPNPDELGPAVTVQPGFTLWRLAEQKYGSGVQFVQIFEANRDQIKNPDLIYPGQIFDLPNAAAVTAN